MIYGYADSEGYVLYTSNVYDENSPHAVHELDEDIGISPNGWARYHIVNKVWVDTRTQTEKNNWQWGIVVTERNKRLTETDWTQLPDVPEATRLKWLTYRQQLRDITEQEDPFNIVYPETP